MKETSAKNYYLRKFSYDDGEYEITDKSVQAVIEIPRDKSAIFVHFGYITGFIVYVFCLFGKLAVNTVAFARDKITRSVAALNVIADYNINNLCYCSAKYKWLPS